MHSLLEETAPRRAFLALQALRWNKAVPSPDVADKWNIGTQPHATHKETGDSIDSEKLSRAFPSQVGPNQDCM